MFLMEIKWKLKYVCLFKERVGWVILLCWYFNGVDILMEGNEFILNMFFKIIFWFWLNSDVFYLFFWMLVWKVWKFIEIFCVKLVVC